MSNLTLTPETAEKLRSAAKASLYFFCKGIVGYPDLDDRLHGSLCQFLQSLRPGDSAVINAFRGSLKSSVIRGWLWWLALHEIYWPDTSGLLVSQRFENVVENHEKFQSIFTSNRNAPLLFEMYGKKLPANFDGWTQKRTLLNQVDPYSEPFLTVASLESRLEMMHRHIIVGDDLEGADADTSDAPNRESRKFILQRAIPLMISPAQGIRLVVGTPHGSDPLVNYLEGLGTWKVWKRPILDPEGQSVWPTRFTQQWCETMQREAAKDPDARRVWAMQYMLHRSPGAGDEFDLDAIRENCYERIVLRNPKTGQSETGISYWAEDYEIGIDGVIRSEKRKKRIRYSHCRAYLHIDPRHKDKDQRITTYRQSKWGIHVVLVAPDFHKFVVESWIADAPHSEAIAKIFVLYRKYIPDKITFDPVGAQIWLKHIIESHERQMTRRMDSLPTAWRPKTRPIPRASSRLHESYTRNVPKEEYIVGSLQPEFANGWLHLHTSQTDLFQELSTFGTDEAGTLDGLDSLSQGGEVWEPYATPESRALRLRREAIRQVLEADRLYVPPWEVGQIMASMGSRPMPAEELNIVTSA